MAVETVPFEEILKAIASGPRPAPGPASAGLPDPGPEPIGAPPDPVRGPPGPLRGVPGDPEKPRIFGGAPIDH